MTSYQVITACGGFEIDELILCRTKYSAGGEFMVACKDVRMTGETRNDLSGKIPQQVGLVCMYRRQRERESLSARLEAFIIPPFRHVCIGSHA